ncbi:alpha/beta fold hydrolase [Kitasatospora sp. NPDC059827]|uniref:alpha/beta fold hydrolase n=1 Tax=Kitasatospora sp. NPDC059827 TaxID=3346964 RepID=UPI003651E871
MAASRWAVRAGRAPALTGVQQAIAEALAAHLPGGVRRGELDRGGRALRWPEAGFGAVPEPGDRSDDGPGSGSGPGDGVPVVLVVLVAGMGTSSLTWAPLLPELVGWARVVAYDRAGLGASEPDRAPAPTLAAQVADLAALVRHLDAGRRCRGIRRARATRRPGPRQPSSPTPTSGGPSGPRTGCRTGRPGSCAVSGPPGRHPRCRSPC